MQLIQYFNCDIHTLLTRVSDRNKRKKREKKVWQSVTNVNCYSHDKEHKNINKIEERKNVQQIILWSLLC
jgi:hypothetical protein